MLTITFEIRWTHHENLSKKNKRPVLTNSEAKMLTQLRKKQLKTGQEDPGREKIKNRKRAYSVKLETVIKASVFSRLQTEMQ